MAKKNKKPTPRSVETREMQSLHLRSKVERHSLRSLRTEAVRHKGKTMQPTETQFRYTARTPTPPVDKKKFNQKKLSP